MNNYTLIIKTREATLTSEQIRAAVEDILLRALPPVTLRFNGAAQPDPTTILIAVASDGKREFLAQALHRLENNLPIQVASIEWGNLVGDEAHAADRVLSNLRKDPYAAAEPQSEPVHVYKPSSSSNMRGILSYVFIISWIAFIVAYTAAEIRGSPFLPETPALSFTLQLWILLALSFGPPGAPWRIITSITCDLEGIEVRYLLNRTSRRRAWTDIYGMNVNPLELTILPGEKAIRFSAKRQTGFREEPVLVKTIITRARLRFVGNSFANYVYKRADAPE